MRHKTKHKRLGIIKNNKKEKKKKERNRFKPASVMLIMIGLSY